ncbi:MAG: quinohemoprotein amine dehydrogenase subunit alpha [Sulfuricurvum sp.]
MKAFKLSRIGLSAVCAAASLYAVDASNGKAVMDVKCSACHTGTTDTGLSRISDQRKTPEGWFMTLERMKRHGLVLDDAQQRDVLKYLSDTYGLAPEEIKPYRYVLDQTPNVVESAKRPQLDEMCTRCHSEARIGLQRRTTEEWTRLVHFHVGQIPSLELQYLSRDRDWFGIATTKTAPFLGKTFSKESASWTKWKQTAPTVAVEGTWNALGHTPGKGDFTATVSLSKNSDESYKTVMEGSYLSGESFQAEGSAVLYAHAEYRATLEGSEGKIRQILHFDPSTGDMQGRMFPSEHSEEGSTLSLYRPNGPASIRGIYPKTLRMGESADVRIVGSRLEGKVVLGDALRLNRIVSQDANSIVLNVTALKKPFAVNETVRIGKLKSSVALFESVAKIEVVPSYAVARVGGIHTPKQNALFEAIGYAKGSKGMIPLGSMNGVKWSVENYDEEAAKEKDAKYAGTIDSKTGFFTPAQEGMNPERKFSTNNAGKLAVIATLPSGKKSLKAKSELIVTVQKWVNPPIQ